jgi:hypothetical protein
VIGQRCRSAIDAFYRNIVKSSGHYSFLLISVDGI